MILNNEKIGGYIQSRRKLSGFTQAELGERLGVTAQSVSGWERGENLPDTAILPDLAMLLDTSVDELLGAGSCGWRYRRRITVERMEQAVSLIKQMRELLGEDHFMYRAMVDSLDEKMNSSVELTFTDGRAKDAYVCEAILECVRNGDYVDLDDVRKNIVSEKPREFTLDALRKMGLK
ncbi:MAG: helix-turn-helix domain-containing protein [Eubacteriales bacterium]